MQRSTTPIAFLCLLGAALPIATAFGEAPRYAAHHAPSALGALEALDLAHGAGTARLTVRRVWVGAAGIAPPFGPGWGDANRVRLAQIDTEQFLVLRAGVGWRLLDKNEQGFAGPDGSQLTAIVDGWSWRLPGSDRLDFNRAGNLVGVTTALGTTQRYDYDARGRLTTITAGPQNVLTYRYDERSRVVGVDGPEGLTTRYAYDAGGRLAAVVNAQRIEFTYRYAADGALENCTDSFGTTFSLASAVAQEEPTVAGETPSLALGLDPSDVTLNAQGLVESVRTAQGVERYTYDDTKDGGSPTFRRLKNRIATATRNPDRRPVTNLAPPYSAAPRRHFHPPLTAPRFDRRLMAGHRPRWKRLEAC
jgi:YD repeat-containing protein